MGPVFRASTIALAVGLLGTAALPARADNECGADAAGQNTLTCSAASYATGIRYPASNGLTLNLENPGMVVSGTQGVSVGVPISSSTTVTVNVTAVGSITATGSAVAVSNLSTNGLATVNVHGGTITSTGVADTISVIGGNAGTNAEVTLTGGQILNTGSGGGILASTSGVTGRGNVTVVISGGKVQASGQAVQAIIKGPSHTGTSRITMNGGSVLSTASSGLVAQTTGKGLAQVQLTGGTVSAPGANADGIFASSSAGTYAVDVTGGTVTGGSGLGAAIHTSSAAGGIVNIGAGAVINGGASGVAMRDGDFDRDGVDEIGGNAAITTAGTLNGAIVLGGGTDSVTVTGGAINGNITGDGADALAFNLGTNSFTHASAYAISGMGSVSMNSGAAQIDSAISGTTALAVNGGTMVLAGTNTYTGGTTISAGTLQLGNGGTSGSIVGNVSNSGTLAFNRSDAVIFDGIISGSGVVTQIGSGTTALAAASTYSGSTTVASGTLALTGAGSIAASSGVAVNGTFDIGGVSAAGTGVTGISGSGAVRLGAKALTLTEASGDFGGVISGTGGVAIAGGSQTLSGSNTYTGPTTISAGTLQLGNGGSSGSIVGDVTNNGTLAFNRSDASTFVGAISGAGSVRQIGAGSTRLTGNSAAFTGTTTVEAGMLAVNGTLGGTLSVLAAGRLQGSGTVGSTSVAGTVAPGNSIGTLRVNGNFAQSSGSTYEVEVDPASSASDLIRVTGNASIASGSRLQVVRAGSANYGVGTRYTVLSADGGVVGTYSLAGATQTAFVRLADSYDANHVYLTAEKVRNIAVAAGTPNEAAVGAALDSLPGSNGLASAVLWLPNDFAARDALKQLSVDIHASNKTALLEESHFVQDAAIDRLRAASCAPGSAPQTQPQSAQQPGTLGTCGSEGQQLSAWSQVFGSWGSIDGNGNAAKLKRDIGGFVVGADTGVGGGWRVGALGGYSRASADTDARNSSAKTDSYHLGVYGGTQWGATALRLGANQSWNKTETSRSISFAGFLDSLSAKYDSTTTQIFGEAGHRIDVDGVALEPFARLAYVRLHSDAFLERGGLAALYGEGGSADATFTTLGLRASTQIGTTTRLRGMLGWRHALGDTTPTSTHAFAGSIPFTLEGVPLAKNVAVAEAGVETQLRPNLTLGASYSGQFGDGLNDHGFNASLNWTF